MSLWTNLFSLPVQFWTLARKVDEVLTLQERTQKALDILSKSVEQLERRVTYLEASQPQVVTEAKAAASAASTMVAGALLSDTVTRLTRLEVQLENLSPRTNRPALPPA